MEKIRILNYDFGDDMETIQVPDGYDMKDMPDLTRRNIQVLTDKLNEVIEVVNILIENKEKE